ncbi:enoyl-CoA hydratase/isomerase family protein [Lacrimispora sp. JR3]|uniref:enoyl-CoA hydratase/isomerase family protein n=1 Tax=Lacrimispora sinapis TaxID=3111456 RepID=UPI00374A16CE
MKEHQFETIVYEESEGIGYICMNMPPANKMIPQFLIEISMVIKEYALLTNASGIILYGSGRHFSSGADVLELLDFISTHTSVKDGVVTRYPEWYLECKDSFKKLFQMEIPVVSAISGFCIGSGFELALASHIRICESGARLGLPESTFGLLPGVNGTLRLSEEAGFFHSYEMIVKGSLIDSQEAEQLGVIDLLVPRKSSLEYARKLLAFIHEHHREYHFTDRFHFLDLFKEKYFSERGESIR